MYIHLFFKIWHFFHILQFWQKMFFGYFQSLISKCLKHTKTLLNSFLIHPLIEFNTGRTVDNFQSLRSLFYTKHLLPYNNFNNKNEASGGEQMLKLGSGESNANFSTKFWPNVDLIIDSKTQKNLGQSDKRFRRNAPSCEKFAQPHFFFLFTIMKLLNSFSWRGPSPMLIMTSLSSSTLSFPSSSLSKCLEKPSCSCLTNSSFLARSI